VVERLGASSRQCRDASQTPPLPVDSVPADPSWPPARPRERDPDPDHRPLTLTLTLTTDPAGEYQLDQFLERSGVEKFTKKKDEKLEKLKVCAEALLDPDKAR